MCIYFAADVHLSRHSATNAKFKAWLQNLPDDAEQVYLLGDIFDAWTNTEINEAWFLEIVEVLSQVKCEVYFLLGNHDFLLDDSFARLANVRLIRDDEYLLEYKNQQVLLMHGDTLAGDDKKYLLFRRIVRNVFVQFCYNNLPKFLKQSIAFRLKKTSKNQEKKYHLTLNALQLVHAKFPKINRLICGHFHEFQQQVYITDIGRLDVVVVDAWDKKNIPWYSIN